MITKYIAEGKNSNKNLYDNLFEEANQLLELENDAQITNLDEYFEKLDTIVNTVQEDSKKLCHYLRLPLDEPYFEINANTRTISVPYIFASSGVGIQGETGAEIIYFQIDRYFDTVDLSNTKIQILWKTKDNSGIDDNFGKEVINGKLVFGWPILENITENSGRIKIAIRFIKEKEEEQNGETIKKIIYNFSTLPIEIVIKPGLSVNNVESVDRKSFILERFETATNNEEEPSIDEEPEE